MAVDVSALTIEPLEATDVVAVAQCLVIDADVFPTASASFSARWGQSHVWVGRGADRRVIGFAAVVRRGADRYLEALGVARYAQRRGIGRALLHAVVAKAREEAALRVSLHVAIENRAAIELYRSAGFESRRRVRGFYRAGLFRESDDAYEMVLALATPVLSRSP